MCHVVRLDHLLGVFRTALTVQVATPICTSTSPYRSHRTGSPLTAQQPLTQVASPHHGAAFPTSSPASLHSVTPMSSPHHGLAPPRHGLAPQPTPSVSHRLTCRPAMVSPRNQLRRYHRDRCCCRHPSSTTTTWHGSRPRRLPRRRISAWPPGRACSWRPSCHPSTLHLWSSCRSYCG